MKRPLLIIAIFLLLGAVVNVAVAWGCALSIDPFSVDYERGKRYLPSDGEYVSIRLWEQRGATFLCLGRGRFRVTDYGRAPEVLLPRWVEMRAVSAQYQAGQTDLDVRWVDGRGWPALSMWCEVKVREGTMLDVVGVRGGIRTSMAPRMYEAILAHPLPVVLPLSPIWRGFVLNTLIYSLAAWLIIFAPFAVRRLIRIRAGRCLGCGYDLRGDLSQGCPECGWRRRSDKPQDSVDVGSRLRTLVAIGLVGVVVTVTVVAVSEFWGQGVEEVVESQEALGTILDEDDSESGAVPTVPGQLTEEQINAMSAEEVRAAIIAVAVARARARNNPDPKLGARLKREFGLLMNRVRKEGVASLPGDAP